MKLITKIYDVATFWLFFSWLFFSHSCVLSIVGECVQDVGYCDSILYYPLNRLFIWLKLFAILPRWIQICPANEHTDTAIGVAWICHGLMLANPLFRCI